MSTGQIAGAVVGTVIGAMFGAPLLGFALGMTAGGLLFPEDIPGNPMQDRSVQVSSLGAPIAVSFGTWRHQGNVIWPKNFEMDEHSHTESAKGGPEQQMYTYTATFAVLLCKGPKSGIGRIWMNKKLVVDGFERDPCISGMRFMLGGEDQEPDPLMVARDGSAPAYRDSCMIVFEDLDCTDFGNRPPVVEAEVFGGAATVSGPPDPRTVYLGVSETVPTNTAALATVDPETKWVWTVEPRAGFGTTLYVTVISDVGEQIIATFSETDPDSAMMAYGGFRTCPGLGVVAVGGEVWVLLDLVGTGTAIRQARIARFSSGEANGDGTAATAPVFIGFESIVDGPIDPMGIAYDAVEGVVWISYSATNATATTLAAIDPVLRTTVVTIPTSTVIGFPFDICPGSPYVAVAGWGGGSNPNFLIFDANSCTLVHTLTLPSIYVDGKAVDFDSERGLFIVLGTAALTYFLVDPAAGSYSVHTITAAEDADTSPPVSMALTSITYRAASDHYIFGANSSTVVGSTLYVLNPNTQVVDHTWTYETGANNLLVNPLLVPATDGDYLLGFDLTHVKRLYLGSSTTGGPVTLASIVSAISTGDPAGLEDADIDVSELTDLVDGYGILQQMERVNAIRPLMSAYYFDGVGSEHILKFPKRGRSPVITIPKAERGAHAAGNDGPADLKISRGSELERPYRVDVNYLAASRDYQAANQYHNRTTRDANQQATLDLPLVLADSKAKSIAMVNLYGAWLRTAFTWSTDMSYAKYEPADVFTVETDDATYIVRAMKRSDDNAGVISWEGQIEDAAVYDQEGIVPADDFPPQTIRDPGDTILYLLDMPILRDQDNDAGFYVAMAGTTEGWRGAQLFKSADGGSTYDPVLSATNEAAIGTAQSVLGDFTVGNIFDEGNSVTIALESGGPLISATTDQVLNGSNTAVIGAPGRWEVINYRDAVLLAPDTYQLSGLLRGRRGTEWATGTHEAGDSFVLARVQTWQRTGANAAEIGVARLYKAPPFRTRLSEADEQAFTNAAVGLKPYSPVELRAHRSGADLVIEWDRRSRIGYGTLHAIVPVGEASESYQIQIMDGSAIKRTLTSATETVTYMSADQTADWGSTTGPYVVRVAQVSATVGAGYIEEESLA